MYFELIKGQVFILLQDKLDKLTTFKFSEVPVIKFYKIDEEEVLSEPYFRTKKIEITCSSNLEEIYNRNVENILEKISEWINLDTGWVFQEIIGLDIQN